MKKSVAIGVIAGAAAVVGLCYLEVKLEEAQENLFRDALKGATNLIVLPEVPSWAGKKVEEDYPSEACKAKYEKVVYNKNVRTPSQIAVDIGVSVVQISDTGILSSTVLHDVTGGDKVVQLNMMDGTHISVLPTDRIYVPGKGIFAVV